MKRNRVERENDVYVTSAEYQVLSLLIKSPDMDHNLRRADFPHPRAQVMFKAIGELRETGEDINFGSLLRVANKLDSSIDQSYVSSLLSFQVTAKNFDQAVEILEDASLKSKASTVLETLGTRLDSYEPLNPDQVVEYLTRVSSVLSKRQKTVQLKDIKEVMLDYIFELKERKEGRIYPFNNQFLDTHLTRKAAPGQIILCAGTTGTGKSIYGLNLINGCIEAGIPTIYASLEMDEVSTAERLACLRTGIAIGEWYRREMADSLIRQIEREIELLGDKPFGFTDDPSLGIEGLRRLVRQFKKKYGVKYLILYVDLITQIKEFVSLQKGNTLATTMELAVNKLNVLAKEENICIFAIAQMGRSPHKIKIQSMEDVETLRPTLEQVKNSNALGERARVVISVFRKKYLAMQAMPDNRDLDFEEDIIDTQILKQNMGGIAMGRGVFDGETSTIRPMVNDVREERQEDEGED